MPSFFAPRRKPGWLSILPQGDRVTLVHIVQERNARPEVRLLENFAIEGGLVETLQRLRVASKIGSYACTTLIGAGDCNVTQLETPPVPREERREALRWVLKEMVSYPVDSACLDVLDIPSEGLPQGRTAGVLAVSASEQAVRNCVAPFEAAKICLGAVDIPELAQRNVAALLEDENRGLAFLRLDESGLMLTLTFHGELVAVRRGEMTTQQLNSSDEEQRARLKERLVLELQRSLDNFDRQYSHIPVSRVVVATSPPVAHLVGDLADSVYVPVIEMDLSRSLACDAVPELKDPQVQARYLLAIGAALRTGEVLP